MYLCFEEEEKRMVFPEASLVAFDENGFNFVPAGVKRTTGNFTFLRMATYQGAIESFSKALAWCRRAQPRKG